MVKRRQRLPAWTSHHRYELWGVLLLAASLLLFMSMISYDARDLPFFAAEPNAQVQNLCGMVGAWIAGFLRTGLGLTAFGLPLLGFLWSLARFSRKPLERPWLKGVGLLFFCLSVSSFLSVIWTQTPEARIFRGGVMGLFLGDQAQHYFGWWGAVVVLATLSVLGLLIVTEMAAWPVLAALGRWLCRPVRWAALRIRDGIREQIRQWPKRLPQGAIRLHRKRALAGVSSAAPSATRSRVEPPLPRKSAPAVTLPERTVPSSEPGRQEELLVKERVSSSTLSSGNVPQRGVSSPERIARRSPRQRQEGPEQPETATAFQLPSLELLDPPVIPLQTSVGRNWVQANARVLEESLREFGIDVKVAEVELGPVIARYELEPAPGVKIQRISSLSDDLALALKTTSVRVIAPIPGKGRVGVEVPNPASSLVTLREVLVSSEFQEADSKLALGLGKDAAGHPLVADLAEMPHLLIAGATGSGKTVCVNALIMSILFNATPREVRFLMVDPKRVELSAFNGLPHLIMPVLTSAKRVPVALQWVVEEMENRYRLFARLGVRNIEGYNQRLGQGQLPAEEIPSELPYLVVIIDELADIMLVAQAEVEKIITRLAHLSRAVGIHMILATQRPSVDVLTGVIKANFPARISFQVASKVDSRTVLDAMGAEKLLGKGDLLFMQPSSSKMVRAQGTWVNDKEIERVVQFLKAQQPQPTYEVDLPEEEELSRGAAGVDPVKDPLYEEAVRVVVETGQASVSLLQRRMRLGYGRAARILDRMEQNGIVGPIRGAKPREVFLNKVKEAV